MGILSRILGSGDDEEEEEETVELFADCERTVNSKKVKVFYADGEEEEITYYSERSDGDMREYYEATGISVNISTYAGVSVNVVTKLKTEVRMPKVKKMKHLREKTHVYYGTDSINLAESEAETIKNMYSHEESKELSISRE